MILEQKERECVVCLALEIMNADYNVSDNEIRFFNLMARDFSLTEQDFNNGKKMDPYNALEILKGMSETKKCAIGLVFRKLISVDGQPNNPTIDVLNEITIKTI